VSWKKGREPSCFSIAAPILKMEVPMAKHTRCPNGCEHPTFEVVEIFQGRNENGFIVQCALCGYPIGVLPNFYSMKNAIRNIEQKITASKNL
jgi:hypothetical protein